MSQVEIPVSEKLIAYCGLYCGACRSQLKGRCPGCHDNVKATWCKVRSCCLEHGYASCADCTTHTDPNTCGYFNNVFSKVIGFVLRSSRRACILRLRELGPGEYASMMARERRQSLPRRASAKPAP